MLSELLPQLVVLLLPPLLLLQLQLSLLQTEPEPSRWPDPVPPKPEVLPDLDDLLQVPPGLLQGLHGEPGVGVGRHLVALDLLVQLGQLVEVGLGRAQRRAERLVGLAQRPDLLQGVAADRVGQVLLGVLEPAVEGRGLLGEGQEEVLHLAEMFLRLQQLLLPRRRVGQQLVPALDEGGVPRLDGLGLDVLGGQQLVLQRRDVGDSFLLEGLQAGVKRLLRRVEPEVRGQGSHREEQRGSEENPPVW